jgi:hypothetical protein
LFASVALIICIWPYIDFVRFLKANLLETKLFFFKGVFSFLFAGCIWIVTETLLYITVRHVTVAENVKHWGSDFCCVEIVSLIEQQHLKNICCSSSWAEFIGGLGFTFSL